MEETLSVATFQEVLNTKFRIHIDGSNTVETVLTEVSPGRQTSRQEQFSLLFRGPAAVAFEQATYKVEHDKLGSFDLFLVPVAATADSRLYEAVFNRLIKRG